MTPLTMCQALFKLLYIYINHLFITRTVFSLSVLSISRSTYTVPTLRSPSSTLTPIPGLMLCGKSLEIFDYFKMSGAYI